MTKVEIQISKLTLLKIEAVRKLTGASMSEIEDVATEAVEHRISELLAEVALLREEEDDQPAETDVVPPPPSEKEEDIGDYSSHAYAGTGEEGSDDYEDDDEDEPAYEARTVHHKNQNMKRAPRNEFGVTDDDLEHDDDVDDPEHESVQQAPGLRGIAADSEGLFAALSGMAVEEDPRAARRQAKQLKGRAKVSGYGGG